MRLFVLLLATASLSACNQNSSENEATPAVEIVPAALSFDGSGASDPVAIRAHGERLTKVLGCAGCHGADFAGTNVTEGDAAFGDIYAANLSLLLPDYSDAELDRAIRQGVPKDGRKMIFMPSEMYQNLSDTDLAAIIAYLRTIKPTGTKAPPHKPGPAFEAMVKSGEYSNSADMVGRWKDKGPADMGPDHAFGRHITMTVCTECHNIELQGYKDFSPDLDIAGTYSAEELNTLFTTGKGKSKPDLGLMKLVAQSRTANMTEHERGALIAYLKARAGRPK